MKNSRKILFAIVFSLSVGLLIVGLGAGYGSRAGQGSDNAVQPEPKAPPAETPKATPVAKQPSEPDAPKVLTMAEAVTLAEKIGKGYTLRAERIERPTLGYSFEIMSIDGSRKQIELSAEGKERPVTKTGGGMNKTGKKRPGQ